MNVVRNAQAGTLESSDALVIVAPGKPGSGLHVEINSIVEEQFGDQIRRVVEETINRLGVKDVRITIQDRGALDYCLRARLEAALNRASATE